MSQLVTMEELTEIQPEDLTREKLTEMKLVTSGSVPQRRVVAEFVADMTQKAKKARNSAKVHDLNFTLGALQWVLSRFGPAAESLAEVKRDHFARELEAECRLESGDYKQALRLYMKLAEKEPCARFDLGKVAALCKLGEIDKARSVMAELGDKYQGEAEYHYLAGMILDLWGDYESALGEYEKALELDGEYASALFRSGFILDLRGDEEGAKDCYERCIAIRPVHVNALVNLGVIYDDVGRYEDAMKCFQRVLSWNPNHERAKLFLRDAESALTMFYDEELERKVDRQNKVLEIPVTDFELSVRSRNCLERMNVKTLGDLTRITESQLLEYKNFGETSLNEIKNMMASKGLRLGQALEKEAPRLEVVPVRTSGEKGDEELDGKPIDDLGLSVRSRKCMQRLGITTVEELCRRTEDSLLTCKNFGQTSLFEVKKKLADLGMGLTDGK